ncbi:UPF0481 protein At3g47200 [Brachypodium distachyon]|uniref:Uncharacterized protein n=1 Tax=Brachypodium distachyon TaxID=15368 RepID=A0A0Q3KA67_BRADI|nr:UPF0481 protein At3g47200 [Brachypodium distachyon]KQK07793.1 hypothetical protein BRADI_2g37670v3 [Brachypodium distachyon]|eukprot:XP_014753952.1 UPF0481 protein At3g47200 [Brachypodium distachyon]
MWVVEMEKELSDAETLAKASKWAKHCIFLVPPRFKPMVNGRRESTLYKPQTVALGPFHHDDEDLKPMEEHKLRAVRYLLERAEKTLGALFAAVESLGEELETAYMDLGCEWCGENNRGKFLKMMITDGCFLREVMRAASATSKNSPLLAKYEHDDPVFSWHGIEHIKAFIQRDMLMVENQLPLRLIQKIVAVEGITSPEPTSINSMVLDFLLGKEAPPFTGSLGYHPLDIYRKSRLKAFLQMPLVAASGLCVAAAPRTERSPMAEEETNTIRPRSAHLRSLFIKPHQKRTAVPRSAWKLSEAGIRFVRSKTRCLDDIHFHNGTLEMPRVVLDDEAPYRFHNMMVFEAMHAGTENHVTAYALFVKDLIDSADDVRLLVRKKILKHDLADNDDGVVRIFNGLTRDVTKHGKSLLCGVRDDVETHYGSNRVRVFGYKSIAYFKKDYLRSPWTLLALITAVVLLVATIVQAVYAVLGYDPNKDKVKRQ